MNTINTTKILSTAFGAENWAPLLTKQVSPRDWVAGMAGKTVLTRKGQEMSLVRDTIFKSQLAMTNIALALRAATELGLMPYAKAVREVRKAHDAIETFAMHFAAQRGENHRELVVAEVAIKVKDGAFAELQSSSELWHILRPSADDVNQHASEQFEWDRYPRQVLHNTGTIRDLLGQVDHIMVNRYARSA